MVRESMYPGIDVLLGDGGKGRRLPRVKDAPVIVPADIISYPDECFVVRLVYHVVYYLVLTQGVTPLFGFIFWIIAARFNTAEEVGLAGAVIPATSLLVARDKPDTLRTLIQA